MKILLYNTWTVREQKGLSYSIYHNRMLFRNMQSTVTGTATDTFCKALLRLLFLPFFVLFYAHVANFSEWLCPPHALAAPRACMHECMRTRARACHHIQNKSRLFKLAHAINEDSRRKCRDVDDRVRGIGSELEARFSSFYIYVQYNTYIGLYKPTGGLFNGTGAWPFISGRVFFPTTKLYFVLVAEARF